MPATTGGDADASAAFLSERIGAEFDRRLDARLTAREPTAGSPAGTRPGLPADAVPGAGQRPRPPVGVNRLPRRPLWFGIVIGSVVSGIVAVVAGVGISDWAATNLGGSEPKLYVNAAGEILAGLTVVWALLLVACIAHALAGNARDRRNHGDGQRGC
jgi:hypothetical protein